MAFTKDPAKANRLIRKFEAACYDRAFKGAQHPADHEEIERRYKEARKKLLDFITD